MIWAFLTKPEFFEIWNEFHNSLQLYWKLNSISSEKIPLLEWIDSWLNFLLNWVNNKSNFLYWSSKFTLSEELFDIIYNKEHISHLSNNDIDRMKNFYIWKILWIIFLDYNFYSEKQLVQYLLELKWKMSWIRPELAIWFRKEALLLHLFKNYWYKEWMLLPNNWKNTGNFFHTTDNEMEAINILKYLKENKEIELFKQNNKIFIKNIILNVPSFLYNNIQTFEKNKFLDFFDNDLFLNNKLTDIQLNFIKNILPLKEYKKLIDFWCWKWRLSNTLSNDWYSILWVDLNDFLIKWAIKNKNPYNNNYFIINDFTKKSEYLNWPFDGGFYIYWAWLNDIQIEKFFSNSFNNIKEWWKIIFDFINEMYIDYNLNKKEIYNNLNNKNISVKKVIRYRKRKNNIETTFYKIIDKNWNIKVIKNLHFLYEYDVLINLIEKSWFKIEKIYWDYNFSDFNKNSKRLIIIVKK